MSRTLVNLPLAVPPPLKEWVDAEAKRLSMTRNGWLTMQLLLLQKTEVIDRLRRLEVRMTQLEHRFT